MTKPLPRVLTARAICLLAISVADLLVPFLLLTPVQAILESAGPKVEAVQMKGGSWTPWDGPVELPEVQLELFGGLGYAQTPTTKFEGPEYERLVLISFSCCLLCFPTPPPKPKLPNKQREIFRAVVVSSFPDTHTLPKPTDPNKSKKSSNPSL